MSFHTNADVFALTVSKANLRCALSNLLAAAENVAVTHDAASGFSCRFCGVVDNTTSPFPHAATCALVIARKAVAKP